jgi:hypothetical protein
LRIGTAEIVGFRVISGNPTRKNPITGFPTIPIDVLLFQAGDTCIANIMSSSIYVVINRENLQTLRNNESNVCKWK